jgi:hypothetical protein
VEGFDQGVAHFGMGAGGHQGRWLAARDFLREARAAEHAGAQGRRGLGANLMGQQAARALGFETLAQPGQRLAAVLQRGEQTAQAGHGRSKNHEIVRGGQGRQGLLGIRAHGHAVG